MGWAHTGAQRPAFAVTPGPGQESVWDYPRPPRLEADTREIVVRFDGVEIARTSAALRMLETSHPPTFYLPPADVDTSCLVASGTSASRCEWKGTAAYSDVVGPERRASRAAWTYPEPFDYREIAGYFAFYPTLVECFVDGARVRPQPGGFYGGWITPELVGPFKGE